MSAQRQSAAKIFVKVRADHHFDGRVCPLLFRTEDGPVVKIDRVLDVRQAPSLKAGGQGVRYTCRVAQKTVMLFYDEPYWFIEADDCPSP